MFCRAVQDRALRQRVNGFYQSGLYIHVRVYIYIGLSFSPWWRWQANGRTGCCADPDSGVKRCRRWHFEGGQGVSTNKVLTSGESPGISLKMAGILKTALF